MFVTAVCFLFLLKLKWPKNKNIYDVGSKDFKKSRPKRAFFSRQKLSLSEVDDMKIKRKVSPFFLPLSVLTGADLGGGCRGCAPPPEMKLSSSYIRIRF